MNNVSRFYVRETAYSVSLLFFSGAIFQAFLAESGVSSQNIGLFVSLSSIAQAAAILLCSGFVDRIKNVIKLDALLYLPVMIFPIAMLAVCLMGSPSSSLIFWLAIVVGIVQNLFIGFRTILDYRLPYSIIPMQEYARISSVSGILSGMAGTAVSFAASLLFQHFAYNSVMKGLFFFCVLLLIVCFLCTYTFRSVSQDTPIVPDITRKKSDDINPKAFWSSMGKFSRFVLIFPSFIRGASLGIMGLITLIAIHELNLSESESAIIATISTLGSIAGGIVYRILSPRISSAILSLAGSIVLLIAAPLMVLGNSLVFFSIFLFITLVGQLVVNYAVPVLMTEIVPYSMIGQFTSWRMLLTSAGTASASAAAGALIGVVPSVVILGAAGILLFIAGGIYYWYGKQKEAIRL